MIQVIQHRHSLESVKPLEVAAASQQIVFIDPPYNFGVRYQDDPTRDKLPPEEYWRLMGNAACSLSFRLRPGGTFWWLAPAAHLRRVSEILTEAVGPQKYLIIKQETFAQYQQKSLTEDYRLLFCHQKQGGTPVFNPDAIRIPSDRQEKYGDKRADVRGRVPGQVWKIRRLQGTSDDHVDWHKAQLPPELLDRIVLGWSNPGDSVLDGFAGSGNMGLCCRRHGRSAVLLDQSPTYVAEMKERLKV